MAAVTDHSDDVCKGGDLLQAVADVEDRDAAVSQSADGREEVLHLVR
jgi:hypothetical protein